MKIEPSVIIWTIINFILFMFIVNGLLFKPLLSFMRERLKRIEEGKNAGEQARKALAENNVLLRARVEECRRDSLGRIEAANIEATTNRTKVLKDEEAKADILRQQEADRLLNEQKTIVLSLFDEIPEYINILTDRICAVASSGMSRRIHTINEDVRRATLQRLENMNNMAHTKATEEKNKAETLNFGHASAQLYQEEEKLVKSLSDEIPDMLEILIDKIRTSGKPKEEK